LELVAVLAMKAYVSVDIYATLFYLGARYTCLGSFNALPDYSPEG
jgi:hypothetical protein